MGTDVSLPVKVAPSISRKLVLQAGLFDFHKSCFLVFWKCPGQHSSVVKLGSVANFEEHHIPSLGHGPPKFQIYLIGNYIILEEKCMTLKILTFDNDPVPGLADQSCRGFFFHGQVVKDVTQELRGIRSKGG